MLSSRLRQPPIAIVAWIADDGGLAAGYPQIQVLKNNMAKATAGAPKVFVVPELMANAPVEEGDLFKEHLEAERSQGPVSVRERIEAYLKDSGVARRPADEAWPGAAELARMSGVERQRWRTWQAQHWMDACLKKILGGKAPREVFRLDTKKRMRPTSAARDRNMCAEVLRLIERCGYPKAQAMERVADAFAVDPRIVERATGLWSWDARGKKELHRFVPLWEQRLRDAGKLK